MSNNRYRSGGPKATVKDSASVRSQTKASVPAAVSGRKFSALLPSTRTF